jgi:hypothetical protein
MQLQSIVDAGTAPTFAAPSSTDTVATGSLLVVKNGSASPINVTFVIPGNLPTGDAYPVHVVAVPASGEKWMRVKDVFSPYTTATVTFSAVTSVTAANVAC